jgi:hypothetical protein
MQQSSNRQDATVTVALTWRKPAAGTFKCNVDSACYVGENVYCVGANLHDEHGRFVRAFSNVLWGYQRLQRQKLGVCEKLFIGWAL